MVVISAKMSKKRIAAAVVALAALLAGTVFAVSRCGKDDNNGFTTKASTNEQRIAFLAQFGWEVASEVLEEQGVTIPSEFGTVYADYNSLQIQQGFDLSKYAGCEAVRYTYKILNYSDGTVNAVADIIVYNGKVIAGDVQSTAIDGFMTTLAGGADNAR